jgi:hypothetical protein
MPLFLLQVFPPPTPVVNVHPASTGLPLWMQITSFAVAAFLALLKALEFFRRGTLEVRLTRDSFFRLTENGEALFVHGVLLAREGPVLIDNVSVTLKRLPGNRTTEKTFPLDIIDHGEKIKGPAIRAEHHFYGASPLLYVAAASTQRPVYMCLHAEYRERQRQALTDFDQDLFKYKRQVEEAIANEQPKTDADLVREIEALVRPHYATTCGLVQLEAGEYELALTVHFEKIGFLVWKPQRSVHSFGYFTVDDAGLKAYKEHLLNVLYARAANIVKGTTSNLTYPEYLLTEFTEATQRRK